jgi:murE/murF fusion protein
MKLSELVQTVKPLAVEGSLDREITGITYDSRRVMPGNLFVAVRGIHTDGQRFVDMAIDRGAAAVVSEHDGGFNSRATQIKVADARWTMAQAAAQFYHEPSEQLKVVGVTGTNGKTTTAFMVQAVLAAAGMPAGLLGTVQYEIGRRIIPAARTTPEAVEIQDMMSQMVRARCQGVAMEVSSHALDQHRVAGVDFDVAVFTNLSQDHLDYHGDMETYFAAKQRLFAMLGKMRKAGRAVVNADNEYGRRLITGLADFGTSLGGEEAVLAYGCSSDATIRAEDVRVSADGTYFVVHTPRGSRPISLPLAGRYNVSNALAAIGTGIALGLDLPVIEHALANFKHVHGRLELVDVQQLFRVFVDYAHTEDALRNVLTTVSEFTRGRLIVVFGCGGDRDKGKREPMGRAAMELADFAFLTSDNPRTEDPAEILRQIEQAYRKTGANHYQIIADRREAIERALDIAQPGDTVLIAGKGHEAFQEFANTSVPFCDRQIVTEYFSDEGTAAYRRNPVTVTVAEPRREVRTDHRLCLGELARLSGAILVRGDPDTPVERLHTDTRTLRRGDCFVALTGPNFDGHNFLNDAARLGATAAVVSHPTRAINSPSALALLQAPDTLTALHKLATNYRRLLPPTTRVVAVTGSSGKTTTKEMIAAVLGEKFAVHKTAGNHNNHIGVPLDLLQLNAAHEFGVFEIGTNHPGEIATLAEMVRPEIGVITNVGLAHVEFLGDEAGVAREKGALLDVLPRNGDGLAVLNADDQWCDELRHRCRSTVITIGIEKHAEIRADEIKINGDLKFRLHVTRRRDDVVVRLKTLGRHQIYNALQAAAVGYYLGMDLDEIRLGLESAELPAMRMQPVEVNGIRYVNDCYNANLISMRAALQMMQDTPVAGRKIAVLGDMLELGPWALQAHEEIGRLAADCGLAYLVTVGQSAEWIAGAAIGAGMDRSRVFAVANAAQAAATLRSVVGTGDFVLLKASRGMKLEKLLEEVA